MVGHLEATEKQVRSAVDFTRINLRNYEVHDDFDAELVCFPEELLEVLVRSKVRIDLGEVGDVVAIVDLRREQDGTQPGGGHAGLSQMRKLLDDATDIADAVVVRVFERAWVDLVKLAE
jgi:hypothetical protein